MFAKNLLNTARLFFIGTLLIAPWLLGAKYPDSQRWLFVAISISTFSLFLGIALTKESHGKFNRHVPLLLIPLSLALFYGTFQMLPLGIPGTNDRQFGHSTEVWTSRIKGLVHTQDPFSAESVSMASISVYPAETRLILAHLIVGIAAFIIGSAVFVRTKPVLTLWSFALLNGVALSIFGIVQKLNDNGKLFWTIDIIGDAQYFASFLNRNNAGGYLNMVFACGIGLWLWAHQQGAKDRKIRVMLKSKEIKSNFEHFQLHLQIFLSELWGWKLFAVITTTITALGVAAAASRGAIGALVISVVVLYIALARRRQWVCANAIAFISTFGAIVLLSYVGLTQNVSDRLDTLTEADFKASARWNNWNDAWEVVKEDYLLGTGLGTYRFVYLPFQSYLDENVYYYAENQYLQAVVEMGIPGCVLCAAVMLMVIGTLYWFVWSENRPELDPIAYCGLVTFVTQFVQGWVDFGLYRTGNMLLCAVLIGSLAGREAFLRRRKWEKSEAERSGKTGILVVTFLCFLLTAFSSEELFRKADVDRREFGKVSLADPDVFTEIELDTHIQNLVDGLSHRPDDAEGSLTLARLLIYRYRNEVYNAFLISSPNASTMTSQIAWNSSGMLHLHDQATGMREKRNEAARRQLLESPAVRTNLIPAYQYLLQANASCPLMPRVKLMLAELGPAMGAPKKQVDAWIRQAANLNVVNPEIQFVAGTLAFQEYMNEECSGYWRHTLFFDEKMMHPVYRLARLRWEPVYIVKNIIPHKAELLVEYAQFDAVRLGKDEYKNIGASKEEADELVSLLAKKAIEVVDAIPKSDQTAVDFRTQAIAARILDLPEEAVEYFKRSIRRSPLDTKTRYEFAELLIELGQYEQAYEHAEMCTRLNSQNEDFQELESRAKVLKIKAKSRSKME